MAVVLAMSSAEFSADKTGSVLHPLLAWLFPWLTPEHLGRLHGLTRKAAHLTEYAVLGALWFHALTRAGAWRPSAAAGLALALSVACAVVDEAHQTFVPSRTGSVGDVLIDTLGALTAVVVASLGWGRAADATTGALLWVAALGGLGALAVGLASGAGGGLLWLTVAVAAALLLYRRWKSAARG